jgi:hypothetical protein
MYRNDEHALIDLQANGIPAQREPLSDVSEW